MRGQVKTLPTRLGAAKDIPHRPGGEWLFRASRFVQRLAGMGRRHRRDNTGSRAIAEEAESAATDRARLAMRRQDWAEALTDWNSIIARFHDDPDADSWKSCRAEVLIQLGRAAEAEAELRALIATSPNCTWALHAPLWLLIRVGRLEEALAVIESSARRDFESAAYVEIRLQILIDLKRLADARRAFADMLRMAATLDQLNCLFDFAPALYEGPDLTSTWGKLLDLSNAAIDRRSDPVTDCLVLSARIRLALDDGDGYLATLRSIDAGESLGAHDRLLRAAATAMAEPTYPDFDRPKVFGIGLSKTGTTTLAAALTGLGVSTIHWRNPLTRSLISDCDFTRFDGFTDITVAECFEDLYSRFPNSKFVYTTRPLESWLTSMDEHWRRRHGSADFQAIKRTMLEPDVYWYGSRFRALNNALYFLHESFADAYRAHDRRVRAFFEDKPKSCFLEFDIFAGDDWKKLCPFVGVPVPGIPFPWKNNTPVGSPSDGTGHEFA